MTSQDLFRQFTRSTVHDLRESVRAISLFTELLSEKLGSAVDPEVHSHLEFLKTGSGRLQNLLSGMGEYSVALGSPHWISPVELQMTARGAMQELERELEESHGEIIIDDLPTAQGDFDALQMLFRHLFHNAIRYRREAPPRVRVLFVENASSDEAAAANGPEESSAWTIHVRDNGTGIEEAFLPHIFEPYTRGYGRERAGNGLGLAICERIVENHGGKIWAESKVGAGSSLFFTLPKEPRS